jgi:hypothetical protein
MQLRIKNNKSPEEVERVSEKLQSMRAGEYLVIIEKCFPSRSLDQNAYYWAVPVKIIAEYIGDDSREADRIIKSEILQDRILLPNGKIVEVVGEHKNLSTAEFTNFIDRVRVWATNELNVHIPAPNEISDELLEEIDRKYNSMFY